MQPAAFFERGEERLATRKQQRRNIIEHVDEVDDAWHQPPKDDHEHTEPMAHAIEQLIERQCDEDTADPGEEVGDDAKAEEQLVSGDVSGRRRRVFTHDKLANNIDRPENGKAEEKVKASRDSPWVIARTHSSPR